MPRASSTLYPTGYGKRFGEGECWAENHMDDLVYSGGKDNLASLKQFRNIVIEMNRLGFPQLFVKLKPPETKEGLVSKRQYGGFENSSTPPTRVGKPETCISAEVASKSLLNQNYADLTSSPLVENNKAHLDCLSEEYVFASHERSNYRKHRYTCEKYIEGMLIAVTASFLCYLILFSEL
mmetsp:Transcript_4671/g.5594  ORF Transcript_4671/g.5594 Transcript_4671/m.5594 type:complete len:180 (-) Transcript_4671:810-1349(-)